MSDTRITLSALWVALVLIYLLGDVLRIFAGDFEPGKIDGEEANQWMWIAAAVLILVPIAMVVLSLTLPHGVARWTVIVAAVVLFAFNAVSVGTYPGLYDRFLLVVSLAVNVVTAWVAWGWQDVG